MKQLDVCWASGLGAGRSRRLVVLLQHHDFDLIDSLIVAPLFLPSELPEVEKVRPCVKFKRRDYIVAIDRLAAVPKRRISPADGNLEPARYDLMKAIDLIFSGF